MVLSQQLSYALQQRSDAEKPFDLTSPLYHAGGGGGRGSGSAEGDGGDPDDNGKVLLPIFFIFILNIHYATELALP